MGTESPTVTDSPPRISQLFVHPLKGARGIPLQAATLDDFGIVGDRRWVLVDSKDRFISQREVPRLALVRTALDAGDLTLAADDLEPIPVPASPDGPRRPVRIWRDVVEAVDTGDATAAWATRAIGRRCRMMYMPDDVVRPVHPDFAVDCRDRVGFADGFPLLIISQAALDMLNARLPSPLGIERFRPNIVVAGTAPHAEDAWSEIRVGGIRIAVVKPCARCVVTTIDPLTATATREPLRTLATYRRRGTHVMFGQNAIHASPGELRVGAVVEVEGERVAALPSE